MREEGFKKFVEQSGKSQKEKSEILRGLKAAKEGRDNDMYNSIDNIIKMNKSPYRFLWIWGIVGIVVGAIIGSLIAVIIFTAIFLLIGLLTVKK